MIWEMKQRYGNLFSFIKMEKWLMDKWSSHTPRDLKLTKEEAGEFLKKNIFLKENARLIAVDAKTSVITYDLDEQKQEKETKRK